MKKRRSDIPSRTGMVESRRFMMYCNIVYSIRHGGFITPACGRQGKTMKITTPSPFPSPTRGEGCNLGINLKLPSPIKGEGEAGQSIALSPRLESLGYP